MEIKVNSELLKMLLRILLERAKRQRLEIVALYKVAGQINQMARGEVPISELIEAARSLPEVQRQVDGEYVELERVVEMFGQTQIGDGGADQERLRIALIDLANLSDTGKPN